MTTPHPDYHLLRLLDYWHESGMIRRDAEAVIGVAADRIRQLRRTVTALEARLAAVNLSQQDDDRG